MLKSFRIRTYDALSGKDVLKTLESLLEEELYINRIFIDCEMPILDGSEASQQLKERIKAALLENTTIIGLFASSELEVK